jgi:endo-1,4-beta-xylanase
MKRILLLVGLFLAISITAITVGRNFDEKDVTDQQSLHVLAEKKGIKLGAYLARDRMDEQPYTDILRKHFEQVIIDGQPNWQFEDGPLRPAPNQYDFSRIDEVLKFATENDKSVRMHHFIWGEEKWLPDWLKNGNYNKEQLLDLIRQHILTVGGRYKGMVREWTVVNEAFTRGTNERGLHDWWKDATGDTEYIDKSFIWAREADPNAKLILNDFNNERKNKFSDAMYEYIKTAKAKGVPIDGIGMQMHVDGTFPATKEEIIENMKRFGELGIEVYVTEFDVNMNDVPGDDAEKERKQAEIYTSHLEACIESGVCKSFAFLGLTDRESWYNELGVPNAMPLLFDREYNPKQAYYAVRDVLSK